MILDRQAGTVSFDRPGVELDLGGIGKGYAVDRVVELLRRRGVASALVNLGGSSVYGLGAPPGKTAWEVGIQDPTDPAKTAVTVTLRDRALSVSGGYARFFEENGVTYAHILDPRTGRPVQGVLSVAILSDSATDGDALDNVLFVQGLERAGAHLTRSGSPRPLFFLPTPGGRLARAGVEHLPRARRVSVSGRVARSSYARARSSRSATPSSTAPPSAGTPRRGPRGPGERRHVRPLSFRHFAAAPEPLELGQDGVFGDETGISFLLRGSPVGHDQRRVDRTGGPGRRRRPL